MSKIVIAVIIAAVGVAAYFQFNSDVTYIAPERVATSTPEVIELDNVSEAQKQLNEAKKLLDEEETKILAEIADRETRLEEIREVRLSFSQAPKPVQ